MYRIIATLLLLVASAAACSAQGLLPSVWQGERGAVAKVVSSDPATGNFTGVYISNPTGRCPAVPYDLAGRIRGHRVVFQTSRTWTSDCNVTAVWSGRLVNPTTVVARWRATVVTDGRVAKLRGTDVFRRM